MIHKKPAVLLSSYNSLNCFYNPTSKSGTSSYWVSCERQHNLQKHKHNGYATIAGDQSHKQDDQHEWPLPNHPHTHPTPYQVLGINPTARYSKHQFYHLVKLYHPDRTSEAHIHSSICHLPRHVILERYRLIVTAHTILSDPTRRQQYDRYGMGWGAKANQESTGFGFPSADAERPVWKSGENPMNNATWEDWEKWYQRDEEPQGPRYMSHTAFLSLIVMFAAVGGVGQATRANFMSQNFLEQRNSLNDRIHADLTKERETAKTSTRAQRIEKFLERQDPSTYADPQLRKMLLTPDICESGHVEDGKGSHIEKRR